MGKGSNSDYRPPAGTVCLLSGPNCDDDNGYVFSRMTILWADETFVLYRADDCWPNLNKWEHVLCRPAMRPETFRDILNKMTDDALKLGASELDMIAEMDAVSGAMREANRGGLDR